ncbi:MAG TPA: 2-isopropylmalate synthase [Aldersonia sp.]
MQTATAFLDTTTTTDPFAARYGRPMPRGLRAEAAGLSWSEFVETYGPSGPARLGSWSSSSLGAGRHRFEATLTFGDRTRHFATVATGPISALSAMLHDAGHALEILSFHQIDTGEGIATFVHCERNERRRWAIAIGADGPDSALRAAIAAVNIFAG